ncbi:hypothetical protein SEA_SCHOMBER_16 [Gordonia Phage Schomber]|nr:hypothetical protein SEA_SCHOMBER_16 [Gordonia Phage Schomber]
MPNHTVRVRWDAGIHIENRHITNCKVFDGWVTGNYMEGGVRMFLRVPVHRVHDLLEVVQ